jgi:hypothetical protein
MQYMLMIYGDDAAWDALSQADKDAVFEQHNQFAQRVEELGGTITGGAELMPASTATTIRGDLVSDGPFLETREAIGGFYLIEAADMDQILAIAKHCPASSGGVEIRPLVG